MSLPGYGAEASIYRPSSEYRAAMMAGGVQRGGIAVPQQAGPLPWPSIMCSPFCGPFGRICCYRLPFYYWCFRLPCLV